MADLFSALEVLRPKAAWVYHSLEGETTPDPSRIIWLDTVQQQPSPIEIQDALARLLEKETSDVKAQELLKSVVANTQAPVDQRLNALATLSGFIPQ